MPNIRLLPGTPHWGEAEAVALRDFLASPIGQIFLQNLIYARPEVSSPEGEKRRIEQDERTGFERCIHEVFTLADPHPQPSGNS